MLKHWLSIIAKQLEPWNIVHVIRYSVKMTEEKVTDLEFGLRREFALNNVGKVMTNVFHFISTITQYKPKKRKTCKFCLGCFATEMAKLSLNDTNVDENWIESKKNEILKILDKVSNYFTKFIKD